MNKLLAELAGTFAKMLAIELAEHISDARKSDAPAATVATEQTGDLRADCLTIINKLAPTHGPQIRAALADNGGGRLGEIADARLPLLLATLTDLLNAK